MNWKLQAKSFTYELYDFNTKDNVGGIMLRHEDKKLW